MRITTIGIDLAKSVFQLHGVDQHGKPTLQRQLKRNQVLKFFARQEPCLIGLESCASAHFWARKLQAQGHTVKLMAPQFVKPYVKTNKSDAADAEAICEAVERPNMRFVPVKTIDQQAVLALHRARQGFVKARTAQSNQIRGLLGEFGVIIPQGINSIYQRIPAILEDADNELPALFRQLLERLRDHLKTLDEQAVELEKQIVAWHQSNEDSQRLARVPGIGPLTASALVASVSDAKQFRNGRQFAAWLGLVPRQHSSGGKPLLLGISKRGDCYLRTLLIHGARAVLRLTERQPEALKQWLTKLTERRHTNVVSVALANKHARIVWALLAYRREYETNYGVAV